MYSMHISKCDIKYTVTHVCWANSYCFSFIFPQLSLDKHAGVHNGIEAICHCIKWQAAVVWAMRGGTGLELHM